MSSTYTAQPAAAQAPSSAPGLNVVPLGTMPSDGDALSVASVAQRIKVALDGLAWTWDTTIGMLPTILSRANVWMGQQTFQAVTTVGDEIDSFNAAATTADWSLFLNGNFGSLGHFRLYYTEGKACLTLNAFYTAGSPGVWTQDVNTSASTRILFANSNVQVHYHAALVGTWIESSWTTVGSFIAGGLRITGVAAGDAIVALTGNLLASNGNVTAGGTPVGNAGPGILFGARLYGSGTSVATTDFMISGTWGMTATKSAFTGTDLAGSITITPSGGGYATGATVVYTFADGTFAGVPTVYATHEITVDYPTPTLVGVSTTATQVTFTVAALPLNAKAFTIRWSTAAVF